MIHRNQRPIWVSLVTFACLNLFQLLWIILNQNRHVQVRKAGFPMNPFQRWKSCWVELLLLQKLQVLWLMLLLPRQMIAHWPSEKCNCFGPTDFCKSKACQHKSAIYFSAVLKSLVLDSSCHDTSTFRPKEPLICRVSANCGSPKHMDSSLLNNFYCWRMLLMLLPHTPAIWYHI